MNSSRLVSLQIPTAWIVHWNCFDDEEPLLPDDSDNPAHNDSEDVLWIRRLDYAGLARYVVAIAKHNNRLTDEDLEITQELWDEARQQSSNLQIPSLDLGWYGSRQTGTYRLVLGYGWDEDEILARFESRSVREVQAKINRWLAIASRKDTTLLRPQDFT